MNYISNMCVVFQGDVSEVCWPGEEAGRDWQGPSRVLPLLPDLRPTGRLDVGSFVIDILLQTLMLLQLSPLTRNLLIKNIWL